MQRGLGDQAGGWTQTKFTDPEGLDDVKSIGYLLDEVIIPEDNAWVPKRSLEFF